MAATRGPASRRTVPGGLGSGVRMQTPRWRAGERGPGPVPERQADRGGRGAAVRWPPGELLGEPRGLVSGLHRGERRRLTAQALRGFFQSQLPNWVRSGRQSGSREASNRSDQPWARQKLAEPLNTWFSSVFLIFVWQGYL